MMLLLVNDFTGTFLNECIKIHNLLWKYSAFIEVNTESISYDYYLMNDMQEK